jgi:5-methylcytosine-specific restriction endonuclease McrA
MPHRICPRHGVHAGKTCPQCPAGGKRTTQHEIRSSKRWTRVSRFVRRRDGNRCTYGTHRGERVDNADGRCAKTGPSLPVHHVQPVEQHPELAFEPANCRTLCTSHHNQIDAQRRANEKAIRGQGDAVPGPGWRRRAGEGRNHASGASPADTAVAAIAAAQHVGDA